MYNVDLYAFIYTVQIVQRVYLTTGFIGSQSILIIQRQFRYELTLQDTGKFQYNM